MILLRFEIDLVGPDEFGAEEGSADVMDRIERAAQVIFRAEFAKFLEALREKLPDDFDVEAR